MTFPNTLLELLNEVDYGPLPVVDGVLGWRIEFDSGNTVLTVRYIDNEAEVSASWALRPVQ